MRDKVNKEKQKASSEDAGHCGHCHHCIDNFQWMEKIVCLAFLDVRYPMRGGECSEFERKRQSSTTSSSNPTDKP